MDSPRSPLDDFEHRLACFEHAHLPEEWKATLLENAISENPGNAAGKVRLSAFQKIALAGIAACWIAIASLNLTMPAESQNRQPLASDSGRAFSARDLALLARYMGESRSAFHEQFGGGIFP